MLKKDVVIGAVYVAKVSQKLTYIRIMAPYMSYRGMQRGWTAINLKTNREVRVKSAQKLRRRMIGHEAQTC